MTEKVFTCRYSPEDLDEMEKRRDKKRAASSVHRLTFDCYNAVVNTGDVTCSKGYPLSDHSEGSLPEVTILQGRSASRCYICKDFSGD